MSLSDAALVAACVEAVATVLAVIAAVFAGVYAKRAYDVERDRDRQRDHERRSEQAGRIAAWCDRYDYAPGESSRLTETGAVTRGKPRPDWLYFLRNGSDLPVYDLVLHFRVGDQSLGTDAFDVLPPNDSPVFRQVPERIREAAIAAAPEHGYVVRCSLSFTDASGQKWRRTASGQMERTESS